MGIIYRIPQTRLSKRKRGRKNYEEMKEDRAERHDLKSQLWLLFSPFLFLPNKRRKKKGRINSKKRDFKSCLST